MTTKIWSFTTLGFILLACSVAGCERSTRVRLEGGIAPVFDLSGSGEVAIFTVYSSDYMTKAKSPGDEDFALSKIKTSGGYFSGTSISDLRSITYGVLPSGYVQVKPREGAPPPLVEGEKYSYFVETTNTPGAGGYLEIRNSRAVPDYWFRPVLPTQEWKGDSRTPSQRILRDGKQFASALKRSFATRNLRQGPD